MNSNELVLRNKYFYEIFGKKRKSDTSTPTQLSPTVKAQTTINDFSIDDDEDEGRSEDENKVLMDDSRLGHDASAQYRVCLLYTSRCV